MGFPFFGGKNRAAKPAGVSLRVGGASPDPLYEEQFKALRAKFEYQVDMLNHRVVAVTSAVAGEGKTVSCAHLVWHLASAGRKRVLLVDTDSRKGDLAKCMGLAPMPGLSEFLSGTTPLESVLRNSLMKGLSVLPAGARVPAPADVLAGEAFRAFLKAMRDRFEVILLDTPPVLPVADTLSLRGQVDGFLFIYRAGFTPHSMLRQAIEEIGAKNVIGVVLNGVEPRKDTYYQKYYGKYYRSPRTAGTQTATKAQGNSD